MYLSGIVACGIAGAYCLNLLKSKEKTINLNGFQGFVSKYPKLAFVFFICCLGLTGFPITATFIGEDLLFSHISNNQLTLAFFASVSLILDGIAAIRIFARLFLGPQAKPNLL